MDNLTIIDILRLGAVGLAFLFAYFAFRLVQTQLKIDSKNPNTVRAIRWYMGLVIVLCLIGSAPQGLSIIRDNRDETELISRLEEEKERMQRNIDTQADKIKSLENELQKSNGLEREVKKLVDENKTLRRTNDKLQVSLNKAREKIMSLEEIRNNFEKTVKLHCNYRWKNCSRQESTYGQPGKYTPMRPVEAFLCEWCK